MNDPSLEQPGLSGPKRAVRGDYVLLNWRGAPRLAVLADMDNPEMPQFAIEPEPGKIKVIIGGPGDLLLKIERSDVLEKFRLML